MNTPDNDGWEDVNDPQTLKALVGAKGVQQAARAQAGASATPFALETASARDKARAGMTSMDRLQPVLSRVRQLFDETQSRGGVAGLREYIPLLPDNQRFDNAVSQLSALARTATRQPGEGPTSDFDAKVALAPLPNRWRTDAYNREALDGLQRLIDTSRASTSAQLGLPKAPPRKPAAHAASGWTIKRR